VEKALHGLTGRIQVNDPLFRVTGPGFILAIVPVQGIDVYFLKSRHV
jgi:hypothetical protein